MADPCQPTIGGTVLRRVSFGFLTVQTAFLRTGRPGEKQTIDFGPLPFSSLADGNEEEKDC